MKYLLMINQKVISSKKSFCCSYGSTKHIYVSYRKDAISISAYIRKKYVLDNENSYLYGLMRDAIKRALAAYTITYNQQIDIRTIEMVLSDEYGREESRVDVIEKLRPYPFFVGELVRKIPSVYSEKTILSKLFGGIKKEYEKTMSLLYGYIISKTKLIETERLIYLWMSYNGLYRIISGNNDNDREGMRLLIEKYRYGNQIFERKKRDALYSEMQLLFSKISSRNIVQRLNDPEDVIFKRVKTFIDREYAGGDMSPYGFMITDFAYSIRCGLFHANRPILLYSFDKDLDLICLQVANEFLEDFLDKHIIDIYE